MLHKMYNSVSKKLISEMLAVGVLFDKINRKALPIPEKKKDKIQLMLS